jgi:hypothetical protein
VFETVGKTKVGDDDVAIAVKQKILELEVAVNDLFLVDVPDTGDELGEKFCGILFFEVSVGKDMVEELASRGVLENDANVLVGLDYVVETDDVWVFECL